jgi:hypothetical protein
MLQPQALEGPVYESCGIRLSSIRIRDWMINRVRYKGRTKITHSSHLKDHRNDTRPTDFNSTTDDGL